MPDSPTATQPDTSAQRLSDQYEHGDSQFDEALDGPITAPAPKPAAAPTPEPAAPARNADGTFAKPAYLITAAKEVGLTESQIESTPASELREWVNHERQTQLARDVRAALGRREEKPAEPTPAPAPADDDFTLKIKPRGEDGEYDDELVAELRRLAAVNKKLHDRLSAIEGREQHRAGRELLNEFDGWATQHPELFGTGATHDLPDGPERARREVVMEYLDKLLRTKKAGKSLRADADKFKATVFGAVAKPEPKPEADPAANGHSRLTPAQQRWVDAELERPSGRRPAEEPKGPSRAAKAIKPMLEQMGVDDDPAMPE